MTAEYGRALTAGDLEAVRKFWDPQSPNLPAVLRNYKKIFAQTRLEFSTPEITQVGITGDKAVSELTVDERRLDMTISATRTGRSEISAGLSSARKNRFVSQKKRTIAEE